MVPLGSRALERISPTIGMSRALDCGKCFQKGLALASPTNPAPRGGFSPAGQGVVQTSAASSGECAEAHP